MQHKPRCDAIASHVISGRSTKKTPIQDLPVVSSTSPRLTGARSAERAIQRKQTLALAYLTTALGNIEGEPARVVPSGPGLLGRGEELPT